MLTLDKFMKFGKDPEIDVAFCSSAMPMKIKRNALVQEVIRRLRNTSTSRSLPWEFSSSTKLSRLSEKSGVLGY